MRRWCCWRCSWRRSRSPSRRRPPRPRSPTTRPPFRIVLWQKAVDDPHRRRAEHPRRGRTLGRPRDRPRRARPPQPLRQLPLRRPRRGWRRATRLAAGLQPASALRQRASRRRTVGRHRERPHRAGPPWPKADATASPTSPWTLPSADPDRTLLVSVGGEHSCALKGSGEIVCWGDNARGQLDVPSGPLPVAQRRRVAHLRPDHHHPRRACWGGNFNGQTDAPRGRFRSVSAGLAHTCGVARFGSVFCWGANGNGQGDPPEGSFRSLSSGSGHTCGQRNNGRVECWGDNAAGQSDAPSGRFLSIAAGADHTCGLRESGRLVCWGEGHWSDAPRRALPLRVRERRRHLRPRVGGRDPVPRRRRRCATGRLPLHERRPRSRLRRRRRGRRRVLGEPPRRGAPPKRPQARSPRSPPVTYTPAPEPSRAGSSAGGATSTGAPARLRAASAR